MAPPWPWTGISTFSLNFPGSIKVNKENASSKKNTAPEERAGKHTWTWRGLRFHWMAFCSVLSGSHSKTTRCSSTLGVLQKKKKQKQEQLFKMSLKSTTYMQLCEIKALVDCAGNLPTTTIEQNLTWHNVLQTLECFLFWQGSIEHISYYYASQQKVTHSQEKVPLGIKHRAVSGWREKTALWS